MESDISLIELLEVVRGCHQCEQDLPLGPRPVVSAEPEARVLIIGQAPGTRVHETGIPWNDPSGERLREWMRVDRDQFYDTGKFAIMPMGFCYPGRGKSGDNPPRSECAPLWHRPIRQHLPQIRLTLLIGQYAQAHYLGSRRGKTLTDTVRRYEEFLPDYLPLPHPSPRNNLWLRRNPWFERELVPVLREHLGACFD